MLDDLLSPNAVVAGKYQVERVLGRGGMGVVVAARHLQLGQRLALKFLLPEAFAVPEAVQRFLREARATVQIQSEHVARVMDVGSLESGPPYIVMEYLNGSDLSTLLTEQGKLSISDAVDYVLQACVAIAEAHTLGIVHRDLKPANLFLVRRVDGSPLIKVLDFGIAKALEVDPSTGAPTSMTRTSALMGTPLYVSPEQIRSAKDVDARSDIWSLGVILQELITGSMVFTADSAPGVLAMIVADPPPSLRSRLANAPAELEAVILCCLEKDRERRYKNVAELALALQVFGSADARASAQKISHILGTRHEAPPIASGATVVLPAPVLGQSGPNSGWGYTQGDARRKWRAPLIGLGVLGVAAAAIWVVLPGLHGGQAPAVLREDVQASAKAQDPKPSAANPPPEAIPVPPVAPVPAQPLAPAPSASAASTDTSAARPVKAPARPPHSQAKPVTAPAPVKKPHSSLDAFDDTH